MDRRKLLTVGGASVVGAAAFAVAASAAPPEFVDTAATGDQVPFYGAHQAGIITPAQDRLHFVAFDVITDQRAELIALLKAWTTAAARMTAGQDAGPIGAVNGPVE